MSLAPHFASWAFTTAVFLGITLALAWMVKQEAVQKFLRPFWLGDGIALWLLYGAGYQVLFFVALPHGELLGEGWALWILAGALGVYALLRIFPSRLRHPTVMLGIALAAWGFTLGAGYQYLEELEADISLVRDPQAEAFKAPEPLLRPLVRAMFLGRMAPDKLKLVEATVGQLRRGEMPPPERVGILRAIIFPEMLARFEKSQRRLEAYQLFQGVLIAAVLAGWGFGRRPGEGG